MRIRFSIFPSPDCGTTMKIAVLPGDGIGPEIIERALRVMEALRSPELTIQTEQASIGGAGYDKHGDPLPDSTL